MSAGPLTRTLITYNSKPSLAELKSSIDTKYCLGPGNASLSVLAAEKLCYCPYVLLNEENWNKGEMHCFSTVKIV